MIAAAARMVRRAASARLVLLLPPHDGYHAHRQILVDLGKVAHAHRLAMPRTILTGAHYWIMELPSFAIMSRWASALGYGTATAKLDPTDRPRWIIDTAVRGVAVHLVCEAGDSVWRRDPL